MIQTVSNHGPSTRAIDGAYSIALTFVGHYVFTDFHTADVGGHVDLLHV